ncbi:MAG: hypothetical protein IKM13_06955 [Clostridia bacterium]|nr:hypothetical protein [Clostridia bacterium]
MKRVILMVLCMCMLLSSPAMAEELGELEGNSLHLRWLWTYVNSGGDVTKCRVRVNGDNLNSAYSSLLTDAVNHWNTLDSRFGYEKDKVYCYEVDFDISKVDVYTAPYSMWFYTGDYDDLFAITLHKNSDQEWDFHPDDGQENGFTYGDISYSRIYCKRFSTASSYSERNKYIFRHELGHVLGMGHVETGAQYSLMWNNYGGVKQVCIYDIDILEDFYPNP